MLASTPSPAPSPPPYPPSEDPPRVVADLWYTDGNIILETESSSFKVYSGILAQKSSVFRDMLSLPQPTETCPKDVPTVRLYDSAEELTWFLKAILDPEFFESPPAPTDLNVIGGILRLSLKYDVPYLQKRALLHLESTYPSTLGAWKCRDLQRTIPPIINTPFAVLPLVREFELTWILPAVLYCLCSYTVPQIYDGVTWRQRHITISPEDRRRVLVGRAELVHLQNNLSLGCLRISPHTHCISPSKCIEHRRRWLNHVSTWDMADPLDCLDKSMDDIKADLCLACYNQSKIVLEEVQSEIWNKLPQIFGLSSWEVLESLKNEAMNLVQL
jgi:hypothetical protein